MPSIAAIPRNNFTTRFEAAKTEILAYFEFARDIASRFASQIAAQRLLEESGKRPRSRGIKAGKICCILAAQLRCSTSFIYQCRSSARAFTDELVEEILAACEATEFVPTQEFFIALTRIPMEYRPGWIEAAVSLGAQQCAWADAPEFETSVAILHELVHYLQDIMTGVGHWDFLADEEHIPELLAASRMVSHGAFDGDDCQPLIERWQDAKLVLALDDYNPRRLYELTRRLEGVATSPLAEGDEVPFLVQSLLESEAAAVTFLQLSQLRMTPTQAEIVEDNAELCMMDKMPQLYTATFYQVFTVLEHISGGLLQQLSDDEQRSLSNGYYRIAAFLIDLALAHPPPSTLLANNASMYDYEPGIKLARLLKAMQMLVDLDMGKFFEATAGKRFDQAELLLLSACEYPYLSAKDVYSRWHEVLSSKLRESDSRLLAIRVQSCEQRASNPNAGVIKNFNSIVDYGIPVLQVGREHYVMQVTAGRGYAQFVDTKDRVDFAIDACKRSRDESLIRAFLQGENFICQFGRAGSVQLWNLVV